MEVFATPDRAATPSMVRARYPASSSSSCTARRSASVVAWPRAGRPAAAPRVLLLAIPLPSTLRYATYRSASARNHVTRLADTPTLARTVLGAATSGRHDATAPGQCRRRLARQVRQELSHDSRDRGDRTDRPSSRGRASGPE